MNTNQSPTTIPPVEPLAYRLNGVAKLLGLSRRAVEKLRADGRFPEPDVQIGKVPLWQRETLTRWIAEGGCR